MNPLLINKCMINDTTDNKYLRAQLKCKDETIEMLRKVNTVEPLSAATSE